MTHILLDPRGVFRREERGLAPRSPSLDHKILGLVDNSKVNADHFLDAVAQLLTRRFKIPAVLRIRKSVTGTPAPYTEAFLAKCAVAVNAFGD